MFVQVLAEQSANVGVTPRVTERWSFTTEFQYGVTWTLLVPAEWG